MVDYDLIIIGSGPAGMNACLYATRANLKTLVIEKKYPGGKVVKANKIENYLGIESMNGADLALQMFKHSFSFGGIYEQGNVLDIIDYGSIKEVVTEANKYKCYAVIIATGTSERKIGIPGEDKFYGKGVSYCATCDAPLYKNKKIAVVGTSNHALEETLYLSQFVSEIYLINDEEQINSEFSQLDKIINNDKINILNNSKVIYINGDKSVSSITIESKYDKKNIEISAIFPLIGDDPNSIFTSRLKLVDDKNYVIVNELKETKIKGIYAAGDCTNGMIKQIVTSSGDGAIAALEANKYIRKIKGREFI